MESVGVRSSNTGGRKTGFLCSTSSWGWKVVENVSVLTCRVILKREQSQGLKSRCGKMVEVLVVELKATTAISGCVRVA